MLPIMIGCVRKVDATGSYEILTLLINHRLTAQRHEHLDKVRNLTICPYSVFLSKYISTENQDQHSK